MDELHVLLIPPRGSMLFLGGATSSSMLRGDLEIKCLLEELDNGTFDDDEQVFLVKTLVACQWKTHKGSIWRVEFIIIMIIIIFLEGGS
jgi:hypothetical protein